VTTIAGTLYVDSAGGVTHNLTVPAGVTADMDVLISMGTGDLAATTATATSAGGTFTTLDSRAANNCYVNIIRGTGVVAGATIVVTLSVTALLAVHHHYTNTTADCIVTKIFRASRGGTWSGRPKFAKPTANADNRLISDATTTPTLV
jgi:hypothetical protein